MMVPTHRWKPHENFFPQWDYSGYFRIILIHPCNSYEKKMFPGGKIFRIFYNHSKWPLQLLELIRLLRPNLLFFLNL